MPVAQGTESVVFRGTPHVQAPVVTLSSGRGVAEQQLSGELTLHSYVYDYGKTMKLYGLAQALPESDYRRLLKLAVATRVVRTNM